MSKINDGGPAFPVPARDMQATGKTLRDDFAAKAPTDELDVPKFCTADVCKFLGQNAPVGQWPSKDWKARVYAKARYIWADAMLAAREAQS